MRKAIAAAITAVAVGGFATAWAQQKPVSSRTAITVYKTPT
jgi:hypothetical protein